MTESKKITFGSYKGWATDEMFGKDVFLAIKEIEASCKPLRKEVDDIHEILLGMVKQARKEFNQHYYAKKRNFYSKSRVIRVGAARRKGSFNPELDKIKDYINERFPK